MPKTETQVSETEVLLERLKFHHARAIETQMGRVISGEFLERLIHYLSLPDADPPLPPDRAALLATIDAAQREGYIPDHCPCEDGSCNLTNRRDAALRACRRFVADPAVVANRDVLREAAERLRLYLDAPTDIPDAVNDSALDRWHIRVRDGVATALEALLEQIEAGEVS